MNRRRWLNFPALVAVTMLAACASMNQFTADVSTFGEWPQGRTPGSYAFERLPSQQENAQAQQRLEDASRPALARAGFVPAATGADPDVLVQVGARVSRSDRSPWDDALWWHGGFGPWRHVPWRGPSWGLGWRYESARYEREVALLIRERASGKPLFEARASSEGAQGHIEGVLPALFSAALFDFPVSGLNPRQVTVPLAR